METCRQRKWADGPADAGHALDAGNGRDGEAGRVLVVDDDAAVRLVCAVNLEAEGLRVLEAADGRGACPGIRSAGVPEEAVRPVRARRVGRARTRGGARRSPGARSRGGTLGAAQPT